MGIVQQYPRRHEQRFIPNNFLNLLWSGFDTLLISLQVANTLAPFISKWYCFFCCSTSILPDSMKLSNWFWNCLDNLSGSSIQIILGLSSSRTSNILEVVFEPSKYMPFMISRMTCKYNVLALAGAPTKSSLLNLGHVWQLLSGLHNHLSFRTRNWHARKVLSINQIVSL